VSNSSVNYYLNNTEFPLPLFDENTVNPVFHLKQLDNYLKLRNIPEEVKLTIAYRSLTGEMSKTWVDTMIDQITDYGTFKQELFKTWWSPLQQSLVRCKLNLSLSAYFLKYATLASYLDPKPTEIEIIEALRFHYPFDVQRAILNIQTKTISETLEILKRIKLIEAQEQYSRSLNRNVNSIREHRRNENARNVEFRNQEPRPVNKTYRRSNLESNNGYRSRQQVHYEEAEVNSRSTRAEYTRDSRDSNERSEPLLQEKLFGKLKFEDITDRIPSKCKDPEILALNKRDKLVNQIADVLRAGSLMVII
jgi:hypothetical protein